MEENIARQPKEQPFKFGYVAPDPESYKRGMISLVRSDILIGAVQFFKKGGGERNLHSHDALDGFWFVLSGKARFYGNDNSIIGDIGAHEGVFIPRNAPYWFEQIGDEPLQILQIEAVDTSVPNKARIYRPTEEIVLQKFAPDGTSLGETKISPAAHVDSTL